MIGSGCCKISSPAGQTLGWTRDSAPPSVQHRGVNPGGANIGRPEQVLHGANVVALFKQVGSKGMAESGATGGLGAAGPACGVLERAVQDGCVELRASVFTETGGSRDVCGRNIESRVSDLPNFFIWRLVSLLPWRFASIKERLPNQSCLPRCLLPSRRKIGGEIEAGLAVIPGEER